MTRISILQGRDLSENDLYVINYWRKKEFKSKTRWNKANSKVFYDSLIFLLRENDKILAFGRLRPVVIHVNTQEHRIMGIAAIVSIIKGKGYGKMLMQEIKKYLEEHRTTGIGFCGPQVTPFYQKCGFRVIKKGQRRFVYIDENNIKHANETGDVFYQTKNIEMQKFLNNNALVFTHYIPHW